MGGWGADDDTPDERTLREAENGRAQARRVSDLVREGLLAGTALRLAPELVLELHKLSMDGLLGSAGRVRERSDGEIFGSRHVLPPRQDVPQLLASACDFVNVRSTGEPVFLAAYILWRLCWIHPFEDGNGRTARAVSYLVLSLALNAELPGSQPIPARMKVAPIAYRRALEAADAAWSQGQVDVSEMEKLLAFYLQAQLLDEPPTLPP